MTYNFKIDLETYAKIGDIACGLFSSCNDFLIEAVREGIRDFERFCTGYRNRDEARRAYLKTHPCPDVPKEAFAFFTVRMPHILLDRLWELHIKPISTFYRIWLLMYLEHPISFWEGRE